MYVMRVLLPCRRALATVRLFSAGSDGISRPAPVEESEGETMVEVKDEPTATVPMQLDGVPDFKVLNEVPEEYRPGSRERELLQESLERLASHTHRIPVALGENELPARSCVFQMIPHDHQKRLARVCQANETQIKEAMDTAYVCGQSWAKVPMVDRIKIWLTAADLVANKYRYDLVAATMLGQSKNATEADLDAACELVDFLRFNAYYAKELLKVQPISPDPDASLNTMLYRPLDGVVVAISPFNFTSIGGNLALTPALMGNPVVWKPSNQAALASHMVLKIMLEAGLPPGVINMIPAEANLFAQVTAKHPLLSAVNFTGSAAAFDRIWRAVANNITHFRNYPRLIGECGGKNFHLMHNSADATTVVMCTIRAAFEFSGQKCSACSRLYVPQSRWQDVQLEFLRILPELTVGDPADFTSFTGAVISEAAFDRIAKHINAVREDDGMQIIAGGSFDKRKGFFVEPTVVLCDSPTCKLMTDEIFGPVLAVYVYDDEDVDKILEEVDESTPYALTGAIFADDESFVKEAVSALSNASSPGNLYVNDKATGAVVGQQPFGGARRSGTNDKAGGPFYLLKFVSLQNVTENYQRRDDWKYPYMEDAMPCE